MARFRAGGPSRVRSFALFRKIGWSWSLSVVVTYRHRDRAFSPCSRINRFSDLWFTTRPCSPSAACIRSQPWLEPDHDGAHRLDKRSVIDSLPRLVVADRARDPHQTASLRDGEATGSASVDMGALLVCAPGRRASTSLSESGNRIYNITAKRMISDDVRKCLKGLGWAMPRRWSAASPTTTRVFPTEPRYALRSVTMQAQLRARCRLVGASTASVRSAFAQDVHDKQAWS